MSLHVQSAVCSGQDSLIIATDVHCEMVRMHCLLAGAEWTSFNSSSSWSRRQRFMLYGDNNYRFSRPVFITLMLRELANPDMLFPVSATLQAGLDLRCMTLLCMLVHFTFYFKTLLLHMVLVQHCLFSCDMRFPIVHLTKPLLANLSVKILLFDMQPAIADRVARPVDVLPTVLCFPSCVVGHPAGGHCQLCQLDLPPAPDACQHLFPSLCCTLCAQGLCAGNHS